VIHSFWVPEFLEKRDLIPGVDNAIDVDVNRTGTWTGRCAEFCGLDHWLMSFEVQAMEPDDFEAWLAEQAPTAGESA
jgi:cytochrome c oxidase subunit 2